MFYCYSGKLCYCAHAGLSDLFLIAGFCVLVRLIGFYPSAVLLIPCIMYRLECRNKKQMLLTALCVTLFIYLVFGQLLHTALPSSVFLE